MTQILLRGDIFKLIGCTDPLAVNYEPTANPCLDCCIYGMSTIGCTDPLAFNYDSNANIGCTDCCLYTAIVIEQESVVEKPRNIGDKPVVGGDCIGPYRLEGNIFFGVEGVQCCTSNNRLLGLPPLGYQYYWDGSTCKIIPVCPTNTTCVSCDNFNWWNNLYITNHNGQSLSVTSPILWQQIVDLVTNNGETISVNTLNGDLVTQDCCKGVFKDGICYCQQVEEFYKPRCISNIGDFLNLISTPIGYDFFINNFSIIGPSLGLTLEETNFIKLNINSTADVNNNGIKDLTDCRLTLSNALNVTGGFYVNFGTLTNTPVLVTQTICSQYGGYWDGTNCMCDPVIDQCDIGISQVQIINSFDIFNNPIQVVTSREGNKELDEACCNRISKDNPNLGWVWQSPNCLASPKEDCLPAVFNLNNELMKVPSCGNDLELSMWVYFEKPENPCQPIPNSPDIDIITIDGQACDITLSPNTGAINNTLNQSNITNAYNLLKRNTIQNTSPVTEIGVRPEIGFVSTTPKVCCYNTSNPILARISTTEPSLNQFLTQVKEYNSSTDYFDKWVEIKATLPTSGLTLNFGLNLEITQGLNCCCDYNFFIDDIQVNCVEQTPSLIYNNVQCPGFNLTRVIDNKKSWVYNPGVPSVGISEYDNIERSDGSFGMLNGEGTINRTFAPSLDANIPWRYTDYWQQSSIYEKHSNLVLNSKELWLTFDMCADCPISATTLVCPQGYTLSANTQICYQEVDQKIFQDGDDFIFMDGDNYIFQ